MTFLLNFKKLDLTRVGGRFNKLEWINEKKIQLLKFKGKFHDKNKTKGKEKEEEEEDKFLTNFFPSSLFSKLIIY
jgi:hypothetical protein